MRRYGRRARRAAAHADRVDPRLLGVELRRFARTDGHALRSSRQRAPRSVGAARAGDGCGFGDRQSLGAVGTSDPVTGVLAAPQLISSGNGTANVRVLALLPDGFSVVAVDSVTETVRQVARHLGVEPLRVVLTANDSVSLKPVARDARGAAIPDATITLTVAAGIPITGQLGRARLRGRSNENGVDHPGPHRRALPDSNPPAPQVPVDRRCCPVVTLLKPDTVVAGTTQRSDRLDRIRYARATGGRNVGSVRASAGHGAGFGAARRDRDGDRPRGLRRDIAASTRSPAFAARRPAMVTLRPIPLVVVVARRSVVVKPDCRERAENDGPSRVPRASPNTTGTAHGDRDGAETASTTR